MKYNYSLLACVRWKYLMSKRIWKATNGPKRTTKKAKRLSRPSSSYSSSHSISSAAATEKNDVTDESQQKHTKLFCIFVLNFHFIHGGMCVCECVCAYEWMSVFTIKMWPICPAFALFLWSFIFFCHIHPTTFLFLFFRTLFCICLFLLLLLVQFFRRNFFCSARCEHLHLQHRSLSLFTMMIFFLSKKEDCFVWQDCMGCVSLHVCVCVVYFSYFETLQRIHFRWKFSQIEKPQHLNERWDVDFGPFSPVMMLQFVCEYRFQRWCIILHLTRYNFHIILQCINRENRFFCCRTLSLSFSGYFVCFLWIGPTKQTIASSTSFTGYIFSPSIFICALILLLSSIYLFFWCVCAIFRALPSIISGIN